MGIPLFTVIKKGLYTSFQDLGRFGFQRFGVVTGGAADSYSYQIANCLVGNKRGEVCLEITMIGPELVVEAEELILSVCGADLSFTVNGTAASLWRALRVKKGDVLRFGKPVSGVRAYLAVEGGFQANEVLGSKSYDGKAQLGTRIDPGDVLYGNGGFPSKRAGLMGDWIPEFTKDMTVKVIVGPHQDYFTNDSVEQFFSDTYVVKQGDRMGLRLQGSAPLKHVEGADIPSDAIPLGAIQVPSNGDPIILLADRQTTGGYTRIGTVISADIWKIAQLPPGGTVRFVESSVEEAHELYKRRERFLRMLES